MLKTFSLISKDTIFCADTAHVRMEAFRFFCFFFLLLSSCCVKCNHKWINCRQPKYKTSTSCDDNLFLFKIFHLPKTLCCVLKAHVINVQGVTDKFSYIRVKQPSLQANYNGYVISDCGTLASIWSLRGRLPVTTKIPFYPTCQVTEWKHKLTLLSRMLELSDVMFGRTELLALTDLHSFPFFSL